MFLGFDLIINLSDECSAPLLPSQNRSERRHRWCFHIFFGGKYSFCHIFFKSACRLKWQTQVVIFVRSVVLSVAVSNGYGKHLWFIPLDRHRSALEWTAIMQSISILTGLLPKLGVAAFLNRLFNVTRDLSTGITLYFPSILLLVTAFIGEILLFKQCKPVDFTWDKSISSGSCKDPSTFLKYIYFLYCE